MFIVVAGLKFTSNRLLIVVLPVTVVLPEIDTSPDNEAVVPTIGPGEAFADDCPVGPNSAQIGVDGVPKFSYTTPVSLCIQMSCELAVVGAVF